MVILPRRKKNKQFSDTLKKLIGHFDQKKLVLPDHSEELVKLTKEFVNSINLSDWSSSTNFD